MILSGKEVIVVSFFVSILPGEKSPSGNVFGQAVIGRGSAAVVVVIPRLSVARGK